MVWFGGFCVVFNRNCQEIEKVYVGVGNVAPVLLWAYEVGLKSRKQLKQWAGGWWYMQIIGGLILVLDKCLRNVYLVQKVVKMHQHNMLLIHIASYMEYIGGHTIQYGVVGVQLKSSKATWPSDNFLKRRSAP